MVRLVLTWFVAAALVAGCGVVPENVGVVSQAVGEPMNGFPSPEERLGIMAINRARSDPATVRGPGSQMYPARPPVMWSYDFSRSSRFHATNLAQTKVQLMHDSPCPLNANVAQANCDGNPQCACAQPVGNACRNCANVPAVNNGCGTPTFTRIGYFASGASGEVAAAGTGSTKETVDLWMDEAAGADGHRRNLLDQGTSSNVMGFGHANNGGCWSTFDVSDSGNDNVTVPAIPTAAIDPVRGPANMPYRLYATWADPGQGAPKSLNVVVDGACHAMALELGDPTRNATYTSDVTLAAGCHTYWVLGRGGGGARVTYPSSGAITVSVGGVACAAEFVAQAPAASCEGAASHDMAISSSHDQATSHAGHDLASTAPGDDLATDDGALDEGSGDGSGCSCSVGARRERGASPLALLFAAAIFAGALRRR
jgi:hypothetical protein